MIKKNISKRDKEEKEVTVLSGLKKHQSQHSTKKAKLEKEARIKKLKQAKQDKKEQLDDIVKKIHKTKNMMNEVSGSSSAFKSQFTDKGSSDHKVESQGKNFRKMPQSSYKGTEIDVNFSEELAENCYTSHFDHETSLLKKQMSIQKEQIKILQESNEDEKNIDKKASDQVFNTNNQFEEDYGATLGNLIEDEIDFDQEELNNGVSFKDYMWKEKPKRNMYKTKTRMYEGIERTNNFGEKNQFAVKQTKKINPDMVIPQEYEKDEHMQNLLNKYVDYVMVDPQERNSENYRNLAIEHIMNHILKCKEVDADNFQKYNERKKLTEIQDEQKHPAENQDELTNELEEDASDSKSNEMQDDNRDLDNIQEDLEFEQNKGFTRGRVLIVCPYKVDCFNIVATMIDMVNTSVMAKGKKPQENHKFAQFETEFFGEDTSFDDSFRIGICIKNNKVLLYVPYTKADIVIGSPLGLRLAAMGREDDEAEEQDEDQGAKSSYSFLSSIEVLFIDKAHLLFMQNFEHVQELMKNQNLIPKHKDCVNNFNEIRPYFSENLSKFYRQNIVYTDYNFNELNNQITKYFFNYEGLLKEKIFFDPILKAQNYMNINFEFMRIDIQDHTEEFDKRFNYFVNNFWERIRKKDIMHKMIIFVNSYFEFVKLKAHFKKVNSPVAFISEYTEEYKIRTKMRNYHKGVYQYILISERAHFYRICNVKNYDHIFFYSPPHNPAIFSELSKKQDDGDGNNLTNMKKRPNYDQIQEKNSDKQDLGKILNQKKISSVTTLFTKMNNLQIERIVGSAKARDFLASNSKFSTFGF